MKKILSLIVIYFLLTGVSWGSNFGSSLDGKSANITFNHTANCDSARAWFGYDGDGSGADTANFYYSIKLLPCFNDDKLLMADNVGLDSIGTHIVKLVYFVAGPDSGSVAGIWLHENPNLTTSDSVTIDKSNASGLEVDVTKVSGDGGTADNLEKIFDEDNATRGRMDLTQLWIEPSSGDSSAFYIETPGAGSAIELVSTSSLGIDILTGGGGIKVDAVAVGLHITSSADRGCDIRGDYEGMFIQGGDDPAIHLETNAAEFGCLHIAHQGSEGVQHYGVYISGGSGDNSDGIKIVRGGTGTDINLAGDGNITGNLTGSAGSVTGNVGGSVASVTAGVSLANNAFTRIAIDTSAYARLWGDDTTRIVTDFDDMDSDLDNIVLYTDGDGSDGIDADIGGDLLDDNPWDNAKSDTATGIGDWFADWFNLGAWITATGFATHSAANAADAVWDEVQGDHTGQGTFGKFVDTTISSRGTTGAIWSADQRDSVIAALYAATKDSVLVSIILEMLLLVKDTTDAQGSGGATDTTKIKVCAGNNPQIWTDQAGGAGVNQVSVTVKQSSDSTEIVGCNVQVLNLTQTSTVGLLQTHANGSAVFALDNDTLLVRLYKPGWMFTTPETLFVDGDEDTTYYGQKFDPGSPPSPDLCRVWGDIRNIGGSKDTTYTITAQIEAKPLWFGTVLISPYFKTTKPDTLGMWYLDLYPNSLLIPSTTQYHFEIVDDRTKKHLFYIDLDTPGADVTVPDQDTWEFTF